MVAGKLGVSHDAFHEIFDKEGHFRIPAELIIQRRCIISSNNLSAPRTNHILTLRIILRLRKSALRSDLFWIEIKGRRLGPRALEAGEEGAPFHLLCYLALLLTLDKLRLRRFHGLTTVGALLRNDLHLSLHFFATFISLFTD